MFSQFHCARRLAFRSICTVALIGLSACGGGSASDPVQPPSESGGGLQAVSRPGEFVDQVKALLARRQAAGVASGLPASLGLVAATTTTGAPSAAAAFSTTTRQEEGVDEDDLIKTDGQIMLAVLPPSTPGSSGAGLQSLRRAGDGSLTAVQSLTLPQADDFERMQGLHWAVPAQRVAALRHSYSVRAMPCPADAVCIASFVMPTGVATQLDLLKIAGDGTLGQPTTVQIQGDLVATRLIGSTMFLVTTHQPMLAAEGAASGTDRANALATLTESQVMPTVRVNGGVAQPLVQGSQCFVQPGNGSTALMITTVTTVDLAREGFAASSRCFLGGTEAVYMSTKNVYLASARWTPPARDASGRWVYPAQAVYTDIHKFALGAGSAEGVNYRASGQVEGHLGWSRDSTSYRLGEHGEDLRVVTFTGSMGWSALSDAVTLAASPARLSVLRDQGTSGLAGTAGKLELVGTLPNARRPAPIGLPGEQVFAVRLLGDKGYVVTFRQTDPLYVLDLADPTDPRQVGELKVNGFSNDLFPLPNGLLLGVGHDATSQGTRLGVKVSLIDVADPAQPRELATRSFGTSGSFSTLDATPHGIALLTQGSNVRVAVPMVTTASPFSYATAERGLQRLQVDTQAKSLSLRPAVPSVLRPDTGGGALDVSTHRSLHMGEQVYYYNDGRVTPAVW